MPRKEETPKKPAPAPKKEAAPKKEPPARGAAPGGRAETPAFAAEAADMGAQAPETSTPPTRGRADLSDDHFRRRVAERAYYLAEQRGFAPGYDMEDWFKAEAELRKAEQRPK